MDIDDEDYEAPTSSSNSKEQKKRFEVKKVNNFFFMKNVQLRPSFICAIS